MVCSPVYIVEKPLTSVSGYNINDIIFAFDKGQGLSEHKASFDALVQVIEGEALVTISRKPFNVKKGEMITIPANKPHSLKATKKFKMILTMLR